MKRKSARTAQTARRTDVNITEISFCLLDIDYREIAGKVSIILYGRTSDGKRVAVVDARYEPYFYVQTSEIDRAKGEIEALLQRADMSVRRMKKTEMLLNGVKTSFIKVVCVRPQDTGKVRDLVKTLEKRRGGSGSVVEEYEYAIGFYRNYLIDMGISGLDWLAVKGRPFEENIEAEILLEVVAVERKEAPPHDFSLISFDTEVVEEMRGERKIIMLSLFAEGLRRVYTHKKAKFERYVETVAGEREAILRFVDSIKDSGADILAGFNTDLYDFVVMRERAMKMKCGLDGLSLDHSGVTLSKRARFPTARLKGRVHLDIFHFVNNILAPILQTEIMSLDAISAEILGDAKIEMEYAEILESWKKEQNLGTLAAYCLKDAELCYRLAKVLLPQIFEITRIVGQSLFDTSRMMYSQMVEWYYTRRAKETGRIIPNQPKFDEITKRQKETYIGGYVREPESGLHENIAVIDFASLYPSILSAYNISVETLKCGCCRDDGHRVPDLPHWFCRKRKGFESTVISDLLSERERLKGEMKKSKPGSVVHALLNARQFAVKTISNASYGYYGFAASKWYSKECAESITAIGRYWIKRIIDRAEEKGFRPLYGDTDSAFLGMGTRNRKEVLLFLEDLNRELPGIMRVDLEDFYVRGIFIPREIGRGTAKKRYALINDKGVLKIRGLERVRRDWSGIARRMQEEIIRLILGERNRKEAIDLVKDTIRRIREKDLGLKDVMVYEQITRPLSEYKVTAPHISAAKKLAAKGIRVSEGSVIGFVIESGEGPVSGRAVPIEFADIQKIDSDYYINHQILPAAMRILKVVGVKEEEFRSLSRGKASRAFVAGSPL